MVKWLKSLFSNKELEEKLLQQQFRYEIAVDSLKYIYYTSNNARHEWEIVDEVLRKLGEV